MSKPVFYQRKINKSTIVTFIIAIAIAIVFVFVLVSTDLLVENSSSQNTATTTILQGAIDFNEEVIVSGLENPWDVAFLPDGTLIFTERDGLISASINGQKQLIENVEDVDARGEGGLLGITIDSEFENNSHIYLCYNANTRNGRDVRVVRYNLNLDVLALEEPREMVTGIPAKYDGTHSGCRIEFTSQGELWITTGDSKNYRAPQDPQSLAGKILRVDRQGQGVRGNATGEFDPRIFSYGHRNPQGLVLFEEPKDNVFGFSSEHGPDIDDEINLLVRGNFGWDPGSGYNEDVPMTDLEKFPNAIEAIWSSGNPTLAVSGIELIRGNQWRELDGALAVANLKAEQLLLLSLDEEFNVVEERVILTDYGRIRSVTQGPEGNLYVTTDNGENDQIIKLSPKS